MAQSSAPRSQIIAAPEIKWEAAHIAGQLSRDAFAMKRLWVAGDESRRLTMMRLPPKALLGPHRHVGDELVYVIEGALADEAGIGTAGNVAYRPNGCAHTVSATNGATLLTCLTGRGEPATAKDIADSPRSSYFDLHRIGWTPGAPGVREKQIWQDSAAGRRLLMLQFEPGAVPPRHRHVGDELVYVIEGTIEDESGALRAGNVGYRPAGCEHTVTSKTGATIIAFMWGGVEPA